MRVLAAALRRDVRDRALNDFQQCLLHALAGDVARDGGVLALAGDLVDLVDIDDSALGELHVVIRRLKQAEQNVFHIVADVARLGEGRRVRDGERHLQNAGERLGKERLAAASGAEEQDVALLQLHLVVAAEEDAFIVVVDGHGQRDLGRLLPDDILVEHLANFARRGDGVGRFQLVVRLIAVLQHVHAQADALIADAHARPLDHAVHFVLALAAERAAKLFFPIFTHKSNCPYLL